MFTVYVQNSMLTPKFILFRVFPAFLASLNTSINSYKYTMAMSIFKYFQFLLKILSSIMAHATFYPLSGIQ